MWDRWQAGDSLNEIARLFDRGHSSVQGIFAETGGIRPRPRSRSRRALTLAEREEISRGMVTGQSLRAIATSFYYQDPDGNRIELQVESCNSKDAFDYMRSEAFANNPVGVEVDPEALLARYRAGATEAELTARPEGNPSPIPDAHGIA